MKGSFAFLTCVTVAGLSVSSSALEEEEVVVLVVLVVFVVPGCWREQRSKEGGSAEKWDE